MRKFYEIIGLGNVNGEDLREDIINYVTVGDNGTQRNKYVILLNPIELATMKMRLLNFNLRNDTRIGLIPA